MVKVINSDRAWLENDSGSSAPTNYNFEDIFAAYVDYKKQFNFD